MKKIFLSMAAVSAIAVAAPASAQYAQGGYQNQSYQNGYGANGNISARIEQLRVRIQAGIQSGAISRSEATSLRQQLRDLTRLERQYSLNGLTGQERADLQQRLRNLRQQVRDADGGRGYGQNEDGYGNDQYGQGGQYDRMDRDNDGFDDRDYNRDGRWDDRDRGYEQPTQRGGIGGLFDRVLGTGGLRVGQRASGNLYAVPYEYQGQFRDGGGVYYRSDGRQIYQIDARTQTVIRVYPMNR